MAAKVLWSKIGDGILCSIAVRPEGGERETLASRTVNVHEWQELKADLSRWAGKTVDLYLIADPGKADNTYGDGGGWSDLSLTVP